MAYNIPAEAAPESPAADARRIDRYCFTLAQSHAWDNAACRAHAAEQRDLSIAADDSDGAAFWSTVERHFAALCNLTRRKTQ